MNDSSLFAAKLLGGFLIFAYGVLEVVHEHRRRDAGARGFSRIGVWLLLVAGGGFLINTLADGFTQSRDAREKAVADSLFRARTEDITRSQRAALAEILSVRAESDSLRKLQLAALVRLDSATAAEERLSLLQQKTVRGLASELEFSRRISDSLQASVAMTRAVADTLRAAEARAAERARETLATVESSMNPVAWIRARAHMSIPRNTPTQARAVDRLYSFRRGERRLPRVRSSGRWAIAEIPRQASIALPSRLTLDFWRGDSECRTHSGDLLAATIPLDYNSADVMFADGVRIDWDQDSLEFRTARNVSVDDLMEACVTVGFYGDPMYSAESVTNLWGSATVSVSEFVFPQGRRASVEYRPDHHVSPDMSVVAWVGRMKFDDN